MKRTRAQIDETLKRLGDLWAKSPHMRLGQLLVNVTDRDSSSLFYLEDSRLLDYMSLWVERDGQQRQTLDELIKLSEEAGLYKDEGRS